MTKRISLNAFHLKLLAIIFMTIDHLGAFIFSNYKGLEDFTLFLRIIGRLSLPLFAFLLVESIFHTRNVFKYLLRLFISAVSISLVLLLINKSYIENIFIDLFLGASLIATLNLPKYKKFYSLIPFIAIILLLVFFDKIPVCLSISYHFYSISLILGFYLSSLLGKKYHCYLTKVSGTEETNFEEIVSTRKIQNYFALLFLIAFNLLCWALNYFIGGLNYLIGTVSIQVYSIFTGFIILFYNGNKGYSALWWKYGCYLYYPLHIAIIYMVYLIL